MKQEYSLEKGKKHAFKVYISETKNLIDSKLSEFVSSLSKLSIHPQIEYSVLSKGKRLRPLLTILSAETVGGNRNKVMALALAFELMHTATLVHDDVIDQDEIRRDRPALHKKWSENDAILTGDALIALSVELASGYGENILKAVARSALELCDGEHMDTTFSLKTTTEESYFRMIREKSASLFAAATYCGALAGGGTSSEVDSLTKFGEDFGIAYQLRDDLLDLTQEENTALKDLKNGRITLPLIHSYTVSDQNGKRQIENKLRILTNRNREIVNDTARSLTQILRQSGSLDYCEKNIHDHLCQAITSISILPDTEYKDYLVEIVRALKTWRLKYQWKGNLKTGLQN